MKTYLVTTALIFSMSASADELKYSFPCGSGVATSLTEAITNASQDLTNNIERLTSSLKAKYEIQHLAVTSSTFKSGSWYSSEGTLCATVAYKAKKATDAPQEDLHYAFPCGIGYNAWSTVALNLALETMNQSTQNFLKKIESAKFETVNVAQSLMSFNEGQKAAINCSTVAYKAKTESKEASVKIPVTPAR